MSAVIASLRGGRVILTNSSTLLGTWGVTSALGAAFWFLAARSFSPASVGIASAAVAAMTLLATLGTVGLNTLVIGELPGKLHAARELIASYVVAAAAVSAVLGAGFAFAAPLISSELGPLSDTVPMVALFAFGVAVTSATMVLDQGLIGLLRGRTQLWRNVAFSVLKLMALLPLALSGASAAGMDIFATWVAGTLLSVFVVVRPAALRTHGGPASYRPRLRQLRGLGGLAMSHHAFNLALKAPSMALPVMVVALLSAQANAAFYIASMIAGFLYAVPGSLTTVLYAVCADGPALLGQKVRLTLGVSVALCAGAALVLFAAAEPVLGVFGHSYAHEAAWSLRVLALVAFPMIVKTHFATIRRIENRVGRTVPLVLAGTVMELAFAAVGAEIGGVTGVAVGWAAALSIEAVLMSPTVIRSARGRGLAPFHSPRPASLRQEVHA